MSKLFTEKNRKKLDKASATFVTGLLSVTLLLLCAGFAIDISKNLYLQNSFQSRSQQSIQVAMKSIDGKGSLTVDAPGVAAYAYRMGYSDGKSYNDETDNWRAAGCNKADITLDDGTKVSNASLPYIVYKMDESRRIGTGSTVKWVSQGGGAPVLQSGSNYDRNRVYRVLTAEVHDAAPNLMLSMFGLSCQNFKLNVSAIAFGSNSDLSDLEKQIDAADVPKPSLAARYVIDYCYYGTSKRNGVIAATSLTQEQVDAGWRLDLNSIGSDLSKAAKFDTSPSGPIRWSVNADPDPIGSLADKDKIKYRFVNSVSGETAPSSGYSESYFHCNF